MGEMGESFWKRLRKDYDERQVDGTWFFFFIGSDIYRQGFVHDILAYCWKIMERLRTETNPVLESDATALTKH